MNKIIACGWRRKQQKGAGAHCGRICVLKVWVFAVARSIFVVSDFSGGVDLAVTKTLVICCIEEMILLS